MKDHGKWTFGLGMLLLLSGCASVRQLPPGDIVLTETMLVTAADSGTVFRGADDGSTRIVGGIAIDGWTDRGNGVWGAKLPLDADGRPIFTETLFVNGRRAQRARWPDKGYFHVTSVSQAVCTASATGFRHFIGLNPSEAKAIAAVPADELKWAQFVVHVKWDVARHPIAAANGVTLAVDGAKLKGWNSWGNGDLYSFENLRSAFDAPGEWFYDAKAGEVLYRPLPGETIRSAKAPRDGLETLVAVKGAADVTFENVTFAESAPVAKRGPTSLPSWQAAAGVAVAAATVDYSTNVVFRNCRFNRLGSYALWFREGVRGGGAYSCEMTDLGAGGVRIGVMDFPGRPKANQGLPPAVNPPNVPRVCTEPWMTSRVAVDDCLISDGGRFHAAGVGVLLAHASDCTVTHNEICDLYYTGVSVGWIWGYAGSVAQRNEISFNHIHDIGKAELADMGGVYTLGTSFGTCVSNNVVHGIHTYSYGGWGLYPDEGSQGIVFENNLVYDTDDASFHQHYGKDNVLRNNILLDSKAGQIAVSRAEPHRSLTAERNVVIWTKGDAFNKYGGTKSEKSKIDWRSNLWWRTDGKETFNGTTFAEWRKRVKDEGSVFADPGFVDWQARDFALKPGAAALRVGFRPFDPSLAGRRRGKAAARGSVSVMADGVIELRANGSKCRVNPKGGRVLSFVQDGEEVLWNAEPLQQTAKDWAHGGIPLCWPWFGDNGKGEIHGTAWRRDFTVAETRSDKGLAEAVLSLREGDAELRYRITLADALRLEAQVVNRGDREFAFTIGYHPYFRATERDRVIVRNVDGLDFEDDPSFPNPQKGRWSGDMHVTNYVDRILSLPGGRKGVVVDGVRSGRSLELASENLTGLNVWNPGPEKNCPGNVPGDSWRRFVCVEPVRCGEAGVVRLAPGASQSFVFEVKSVSVRLH